MPRHATSAAARASAMAGAVCAALALALALSSCAGQTPEERLVAQRARYRATLNSFQVLEEPRAPQTPVVTEPMVDGGSGGATAPEAAAAEGTGGPEADGAAADAAGAVTAPVGQDVLLDIVVRNDSEERLPGLTLDVSQVDAAREPKASYRIYVATSDIAPGTDAAVSYRLEDVDFTPGDAFHVEVRQAIPSGDRADYREFNELAAP